MGSSVRWETLGRLNAKLDRYADLMGGKGGGALVNKFRGAIEEDNRDKILRGVDRYGHPLTPLVSVRKGRYRGATGHPLSPFGLGSRVVTHFKTKWEKASGVFRILAGWYDVVSKKGLPFLHFHFDGAGHNPRRDLAGITPKGWRQVQLHVRDFIRNREFLK